MVIDINKLDNQYDLVLADPPWRQTRGGFIKHSPNSSGRSVDYSTLDLETIKEHLRKVTDLQEQQVLFLWTIDKYLFEAERIAKELGFKLHARMIWNKIRGIPTAFTIRYGHEYLLYMYKGKLMPVAKEERGKIHSVFTELPKRHSQKPETAYQIIERLYPNTKKLEMYARNQRFGWDCWGDEVHEDG